MLIHCSCPAASASRAAPRQNSCTQAQLNRCLLLQRGATRCGNMTFSAQLASCAPETLAGLICCADHGFQRCSHRQGAPREPGRHLLPQRGRQAGRDRADVPHPYGAPQSPKPYLKQGEFVLTNPILMARLEPYKPSSSCCGVTVDAAALDAPLGGALLR